MTTEPQLRPIDLGRHMLEGGTFITSVSDFAQIDEAVHLYADPRLTVWTEPSLAESYGWKSLHWRGDPCPNGQRLNLSGFWELARRLRAQHEEWLKLKDFAP